MPPSRPATGSSRPSLDAAAARSLSRSQAEPPALADGAGAGRTLAFEAFTFDLERRVLRHHGAPVSLEPRVAALLEYLMARRGQVVSRSELLQRLWPEQHGTETALNYAASALRRALSACVRPALATLRGQGYRFDAETREVSREGEGERLLGRSAELQRLRGLAARCLDERTSQLVLVLGPAGIGKSRLVRELGAEWAASGQRCLSGYCTAAEGTPPLWPWRHVLEHLNVEGPAAAGAGGQAGGASHLDLPVSSADRWEYFQALGAALERGTRRKPLLITLEDLHLADDASLFLLRFLASEARSCAVLYLATCRSPVAPALEPVLGELARHGEPMALGPLDEPCSRRLLRSGLGAPLPAEAERRALASAAGNPLFIKEIAFGLRAQPQRSIEELGALELPGAHAAIGWHLAVLNESALEVLRAAAIAGEEFDARLVAAALERPVQALLPALDAAAKLEIIRPVAALEYRFLHALFCRHLYTQVPEVARRQLHHRIGMVLVQQGRHRSGLGLSQAAHHLAEGALTPPAAAHAAEVARAAADSLVERFAFATAAAEYRRALRLLEFAGGSGVARIGLMIRAADCLRVGGGHDAANQLAREAVELARALGDDVCLAEATCALVAVETLAPLAPSPHLELLREATERLTPGQDRLRARLLALTGMENIYAASAEECQRDCAEALRLSANLDVKTQALVQLADALTRWGSLAHKLQLDPVVDQCVRTARLANEPQRELFGVCLQLTLAFESGKLELAQRHAALLEERGRAIGSVYPLYIARVFAAALAVFRGSPDAGALCRAAYGVGQAHLPALAEHIYQGQLLLLALDTGQLESCLPPLLAISGAADALPVFVASAGLVQTLAGDVRGASATYQRLRAAGFPTTDTNVALAALTISAELCAYERDAAEAEGLYERLRPFHDRLAVTGSCVTVPALPAYSLARLALLLGRPLLAREHLSEALMLSERLGSVLWSERCRHGLGLLESGRGAEAWAPRAPAVRANPTATSSAE